MPGVIRLSGVTVNAPDALALARFYAEITGGVAQGGSHWATVTGPNGDIGFQQVLDYRPPVWPGSEVPMQMHLEFHVEDLAASGARVLAAGATPLKFQPNSDHCLVDADPAGHPFCLSTREAPQARRTGVSPLPDRAGDPAEAAGTLQTAVELDDDGATWHQNEEMYLQRR